MCGFLVLHDCSVEKRVSGHLICSLVRDRLRPQMKFAVGTGCAHLLLHRRTVARAVRRDWNRRSIQNQIHHPWASPQVHRQHATARRSYPQSPPPALTSGRSAAPRPTPCASAPASAFTSAARSVLGVCEMVQAIPARLTTSLTTRAGTTARSSPSGASSLHPYDWAAQDRRDTGIGARAAGLRQFRSPARGTSLPGSRRR
jgi:hypothetical protein